MRYFLPALCLVLLACGPRGMAQDTFATAQEYVVLEPDEHDEALDTLLPPDPVGIAKQEMDSLKALPEYAYIRDLDSMLRNLAPNAPTEQKAPSAIGRFFGSDLFRILYWSVAILAVLYLLYQLLAGRQNLFYRSKRTTAHTIDEETLQYEASPLQLGQQAAARGDLRLAVRYHYLYILQLMGEKQIIRLSPQKTNDQYLREVKHLPLSRDLARITLQYEYVWYGEFILTPEQYAAINSGYRKFIDTGL